MTDERPASPRRRGRTWLVRGLATALALLAWWLLARVSLPEVMEAVARISPEAFGLGLTLALSNFALAGVRWHQLMRAYGAERPPAPLRLARLHLEATFYNTFLPANVGGDLLRAHTTRSAFDGRANAYVIVFVERLFGLSGLLLLSAMALLLRPIGHSASLVAALAMAAAIAGVTTPFLGRRLFGWLPGRVGALARDLPRVSSPRRIAWVLLSSVLIQMVVALTGYVLLTSLGTGITLAQALALIPVALAAVYFPTVAGLGAREAAFVALLATVDVGVADATAAALGMLGVQLGCALTGGLLHLLGHHGDDEVVGSSTQASPTDSNEQDKA